MKYIAIITVEIEAYNLDLATTDAQNLVEGLGDHEQTLVDLLGVFGKPVSE